jgi:hypothetical protein
MIVLKTLIRGYCTFSACQYVGYEFIIRLITSVNIFIRKPVYTQLSSEATVHKRSCDMQRRQLRNLRTVLSADLKMEVETCLTHLIIRQHYVSWHRLSQ